MENVMVAGAGKIGSLIALLLAKSQSYTVYLADLSFNGADVSRLLQTRPDIKTVAMDVTNHTLTQAYLTKHRISAVISSLPFFLNTHIATAAKAAKAHYFDLTEDITVTRAIKELAKGADSAFVPQCGLAPGIIGIVAHHLMQAFDHFQHVKLRVGALPQCVSNPLHYALTWSTDGLINAYANPCHAVELGQPVLLKPLEGLEAIALDGDEYEAFNTSGGLGSLPALYPDLCYSMNYKTLRFPGHCEKMHFLMNAMQLRDDRPTLKRILEQALPKTYQDMVVMYVSVEGLQAGLFTEKSYLKKMYPKSIAGLEWSAIQVCTASGVCAVVDLVFGLKKSPKGLILQEKFNWPEVLANRFGQHYA